MKKLHTNLIYNFSKENKTILFLPTIAYCKDSDGWSIAFAWLCFALTVGTDTCIPNKF